jgi:hypothetical protein
MRGLSNSPTNDVACHESDANVMLFGGELTPGRLLHREWPVVI